MYLSDFELDLNGDDYEDSGGSIQSIYFGWTAPNSRTLAFSLSENPEVEKFKTIATHREALPYYPSYGGM